jgi:hypothetical protein
MKTSVLTGKPQLNRRVNRALILDRIRTNGQISRAELAKVTSIRPPTVTAIVRDLLEEGLVVEAGTGKTHGGRAPRMLELSCEVPQVLSFELTDTTILAGMADLGGRLYARTSVANAPASPEETVDRLAELAEEVFRQVRAEVGDPDYGWKRVSGVGIALPGLIDRGQQVVYHSQPLGWHNVELRSLCERRWGVHTDVINDSMAGALLRGAAGPQSGLPRPAVRRCQQRRGRNRHRPDRAGRTVPRGVWCSGGGDGADRPPTGRRT